ncbi:hypothetical protein LO762_12530 [Actinocorallia sp. API 0066]|uniref:hypothetical protein n=1 Tax=Actinocorallia sp. API 0066 TaxID=2896846 RepID=UPI001E30092D|nr:hypothetical protein [Actinocorallia sp. API 0066]MCD0450012.1 hypothetical protein [Actinocorallia sp. API 0066]
MSTASAFAGPVDASGDDSFFAVGNWTGGDFVQQQIKIMRGNPSLTVGDGHIAEILSFHVPCANHDTVVKVLAAEGAVLLTGPVGGGRRTTAVAALRAVAPGVPIRAFSPGADDPEEVSANGRHGYLVAAPDLSSESARTALLDCLERAGAVGAHVVVLGRAQDTARLDGWLVPVEIDPPSALAVYRRHLRARRLPDGWTSWEAAARLLDGLLPVDGGRLAEIVAGVTRKGGPPEALREEAERSFARWGSELTAWFSHHPDPCERALLAASAVLTPVPADAVYGPARALAARFSVTVNGDGLVWPPVSALRGLLAADEAADDADGIAFARHGYAAAVLHHLWTEQPPAREPLLSWYATVPGDPQVPESRREDLARAFTEFAAAHGAAALITATARRWASAGRPRLAFVALAYACVDRNAGATVRRALYEWARAARTPQPLKLVVAAVCEVLGQVYPTMALTRLKHLATHGDDQVAHAVVRAAAGIASAGRPGLALGAAFVWCAPGGGGLSTIGRTRRTRAGALLFLTLTAPDAAPDPLDVLDRRDPREPGAVWRAAVRLDGGLWRPVLRHWLDAALADPERRAAVVAALHEVPWDPLTGVREVAHEGHPTAAAIVVGAVRAWAAERPRDRERRRLREDVVVPLIEPWWTRLLLAAYVRVRRFATG